MTELACVCVPTGKTVGTARSTKQLSRESLECIVVKRHNEASTSSGRTWSCRGSGSRHGRQRWSRSRSGHDHPERSDIVRGSRASADDACQRGPDSSCVIQNVGGCDISKTNVFNVPIRSSRKHVFIASENVRMVVHCLFS